ncbi:hypothetical protein GJ496_009426 [Pomphorhynchus laevis]|nr:hypothetical protein GJ496_009425 [Pomphorhynchus laevis]KAI0978468.1 hypothetical protein GJ496_009426 [Pomphorhynchus laevis]
MKSKSMYNEFIMQQTMLRIKDPEKTLNFYTNILGYVDPNEVLRLSESEKTVFVCRQKACIEFCYNWGSETDDNLHYHNGNEEPRGFGHIGIVVPDVEKVCETFLNEGVEFAKKPNEGRMHGIAFIKDPDGYYIEILSAKNLQEIEKIHCGQSEE